MSAGAVGQRFGSGSPLYHIARALFPTNADEGVGTIPVTFYPLGDHPQGVSARGNSAAEGELREAANYREVVNNLRSAALRLAPGTTAQLRTSVGPKGRGQLGPYGPYGPWMDQLRRLGTLLHRHDRSCARRTA